MFHVPDSLIISLASQTHARFLFSGTDVEKGKRAWVWLARLVDHMLFISLVPSVSCTVLKTTLIACTLNRKHLDS